MFTDTIGKVYINWKYQVRHTGCIQAYNVTFFVSSADLRDVLVQSVTLCDIKITEHIFVLLQITLKKCVLSTLAKFFCEEQIDIWSLLINREVTIIIRQILYIDRTCNLNTAERHLSFPSWSWHQRKMATMIIWRIVTVKIDSRHLYVFL